jgi:hypothetical protein
MRLVSSVVRCGRSAVGVVLSIALLVAASAVMAAPYLFTSTDGGYWVTFPSMPQEQITQENNARTVLNALNHDNGYYAVVHVDHPFAVTADDELEGNITKFTKQIGAPTQVRRKKKFSKKSGEQLPAEEFTFESPELVGERHCRRRGPAHLHGRGLREQTARSEVSSRSLRSVIHLQGSPDQEEAKES